MEPLPPETNPSPSPEAPPTVQGEFAAMRPQAAWPTAIGVISIVLGALGTLAYLWGAVAPLFMGFMGSFAAANPAMKDTIQVQRDMAAWIITSGALNTICSIMLLIVGIGMTGRRPWAVKTARVWAVGKLVVACFAVIANFVVQRAVYAAMAKQSAAGSPGAAMGQMGDVFVAITAAVGLAWTTAYPIFMLVWLSLSSVKAEVGRWKA